jgi:putative transposase
MRRAFKYRLFTNATQERELAAALETHRRLYNVCLEWKQHAWQCVGASLNYCDFSRWFKVQRSANAYFARLNFSSAQATMRRCDKSFVNFFRRVQQGAAQPGYPRFKGRDFFDSIEYPAYGDGIRLTGNRLYVQYVGTIRVKLHRPVEGKIKTVTLKREGGKWFVVVSCDLPDVPLKPVALPPVGIDVGLTHFLTTSDGATEPNPRYLKTALPELRRAGRSVARKKKGGTNRRKAVRRLQRVHARVKNLRRAHHYQVACRLVLAYGLIAVESLNVHGMLGNRRLSRAISDAGWSGFLNVLHSQAQKAGVQCVDVDPKGTTQECSGCHQEVKKDLSVRWHDCPGCGLSLDRDHNAALNILARGLARTAPAGVNVGQKVKRPPRSRRLQATE